VRVDAKAQALKHFKRKEKKRKEKKRKEKTHTHPHAPTHLASKKT
jgi:hypothetical protein